MNAVFLDTVGLLALWDMSDQWHVPAEYAFSQLTQQRLPIVTTTYILLECGNAAARRPYRNEVPKLREVLLKRNELIEPTEEDVELAWEGYQRGEAAQAGIVDHVSIAVMRRLGIKQVFSNDKHFEAAGFEILFGHE